MTRITTTMEAEPNASAVAPVRVFFVPHRLEQPRNEVREVLRPEDDTPYRVPFTVRGALVSASGTTDKTAVVMVDGYKTRKHGAILGGNQDPCVCGAPVGVFHAYCRIANARRQDDKVHVIAGESGLLPAIARPQDIIVYGKPDLQRREIGIDSVIVVASTPVLSEMIGDVAHETDAFAFSISDQLPLGFHAAHSGQQIVVGATTATREAVQEVRTSFVPLAERTSDGQLRVVRLPSAALKHNDWKELEERFREMFSGGGAVGNKGFITELPVRAAVAMIHAVIERSGHSTGKPGRVLVPPLRFISSPLRFGTDGVIRSNEEHLKRLVS